jgi:hypothetical protein
MRIHLLIEINLDSLPTYSYSTFWRFCNCVSKWMRMICLMGLQKVRALDKGMEARVWVLSGSRLSIFWRNVTNNTQSICSHPQSVRAERSSRNKAQRKLLLGYQPIACHWSLHWLTVKRCFDSYIRYSEATFSDRAHTYSTDLRNI